MNLTAPRAFTQISFRFCTYATPLDPPHKFLRLLQIALNLQSLTLIRPSHAQILSVGLGQNPFLATKLISAYASCSDPNRARLVFCSIQRKSVHLWNCLVNGYAKNGAFAEAFGLFNKMCRGGEAPDGFTLSMLSKLSGDFGDAAAGKSIHAISIRTGYVSDTVVSNSILSMYSKSEEFFELCKLFDEMPQRNSSSWNVLIAAHAAAEECNVSGPVWLIFREMRSEGIEPNSFTFSTLLPLCVGNSSKWGYGRELHSCIIKNNFGSSLGSDVHLGCCLIDMYSRNDRVIIGRRVFDQMNYRNIFAWTAMVDGYVQSGCSDEALNLFHSMQIKERIKPNRVTLITILPACRSLGKLVYGKQIHGYAIRKEYTYEVSLCNALIDMYSKCGSLDCARRVFEDRSFCKDAISWSSMISAYSLHGRGQEAICLYDIMLNIGIKPDMITVVGILSACARSGLVQEGLNIFNSVIDNYCIDPTLEMCACVVDMLGRSGQFERALDFIKMMPVEAGPSVWGSLVNASVIHGNSDMQDLAYRNLVRIEPTNPSNYVSLSNVHASSRRWDVVAEVRKVMKERGFQKLPGCSWISINSTIHCFYVADEAHPCSTSIYEMLHNLVLAIKEAEFSVEAEFLCHRLSCDFM